MREWFSAKLIAFAAGCLAAAWMATPEPADAASKAQCTAFIGVTVVPMDRERLVAGDTVVVRGDRIASVGPADRVRLPPGCVRIDGRERYLIPGLVDSHVHLPLANAVDQRLVLQLLLANGVTTAINMHGSPMILARRNEINRGEIVGPKLYTTGVFFQQPFFMTADQVRREVIAEKRAGYDFLKVHGDLTKEAYDALFEEAAAQGLRVVGHVPSNLGIDAALGRQAMIVHAEEYLYSYFQFQRDLPTDPAEVDRMVADISRRTAASGTWVSPTLSVFHQIITQAADVDSLLTRPEMRYLPAHMTAGGLDGPGWFPPKNPYVTRWPPEKIPHLVAQYSIMKRLVRGLRDAGVPLLAGTDPLIPCVIPGFSLKDEFEQLYAAGLTPYEVLQSATSNPARFLGVTRDAGTIAPGKIADLVLLDADPFTDVDNVFRQSGVMLRGRWRSEDALQKSLARAVAASQAAAHDGTAQISASNRP